MTEQPEECKRARRCTKALRRGVVLRDGLAADGAELKALDGADPSKGPLSQAQEARADLLRDRTERHERELDVRRGEYADLHGG